MYERTERVEFYSRSIIRALRDLTLWDRVLWVDSFGFFYSETVYAQSWLDWHLKDLNSMLANTMPK
ncbi:eukaryotic initiation factor [Musa troglodytarum]|uniref:Eukaryotic initiation factor n=1 Tax=Musa troglodytarum TaxID=320322 RepID=A0A9E7L4D1_9LILI|nr:eukaryotic initiation factor [Musa troglodytarum]